MTDSMELCYFAVINIVSVAVYGWDKYCAIRRRWRVPEWVLLGLAVVGGSVGAIAAMRLFRHKTLHWKFRLGVPLLLILQIAGWVYVYMGR